MTPRPAALWALWVVGCGGIAERADYHEARGRAECSRIERCELGYFESEYSSFDDCVGERTDAIEEASDFLDDADCAYVPEEAGACVRRIRAMSCEDWAEGEAGSACDLVFDCVEG